MYKLSVFLFGLIVCGSVLRASRNPFFFPKEQQPKTRTHAFMVCGIVYGDHPSALLSVRGNIEEVVAGDTIEHYVVESIASDHVVLRRGHVKKMVWL